MSKQLLIDTILFSPKNVQKIIKESSGDKYEPLIVSGVLQRAEAKNQNGRIYPKKILMREVKKYQDNQIKENRAMGELDHPESSVVNLKNVSHTILSCQWQGNDLVGTVEILPTPAGEILRQLLSRGIRLGISSRGVGSVREINETTVEVQDDFELIGWDFVSNPSTHGAFMFPMGEGSLKESRSIYDNTKKLSAYTHKNYDKISENISKIICEIGTYCEC
ncbi:putative prohead protease [Microcystis phage Mel-JY01]